MPAWAVVTEGADAMQETKGMLRKPCVRPRVGKKSKYVAWQDAAPSSEQADDYET